MERRLTAILAADIVGYTTLMGADEAGTHARAQRLRHEVIEPILARHQGRVVKLMGDGYLVEHSSVVSAVACAMEWQQAVPAAQAEAAPEHLIRFRIGINLGDVVVDGDDIYGDGVNIASRLEAEAEPGGICLSEDAYRQARGKLDAGFRDLGERSLKNVADPVRIYAIGTPEAAAKDAPQGFSHPAVAVLPFDNMSGDPEQAYFSDGLAEDIITALSHWRSFPVIARNSSFAFRGKGMRIEEIGRELGARYVLEGSVRKAGARLRINAQLIDAATGHHVWAEKFDRQAEDVFAVQDEITERIAATIMPELELFERQHSRAKPTEDLNAWDYYLRGMETFHTETCETTANSLAMFQRAVDLDPGYCDAWAMLGWCYSRMVMYGCDIDREEFIRLGFAASRKALALDRSSALAHIALGTVHIWAEETELGLAEAQTAVQLNPNFAIAAMALGNRMDLVGRTQEGIDQMERALTLNPRDPNRWRYMAYLARAYVSLGQPETGADWARKAVLLRPDLPEALFRCAVVVSHLDEAEARDLLARCDTLDPTYVMGKSAWKPYRDENRNNMLLAPIRRLEPSGTAS